VWYVRDPEEPKKIRKAEITCGRPVRDRLFKKHEHNLGNPVLKNV